MRTVHKEWVPAGQTVNQYYYAEILGKSEKEGQAVSSKHCEKNWNLHHDNAPAHTALSVAQFLTSKRITVMSQSPYSPDLTPCDFRLVQKVKSAGKGHCFESIEDIQKAVTQTLNDTLQAAVQECYKQLQHLWKRCAQGQGMYFEGDHIVVDE